MKFSWQKLEKPFYCLAPMEGVTDTVFRQIVAGAGRSSEKPDVFFTEFTSVDGLNSRGYEYVNSRLKYTENERSIVAQIWGLEPENFYKAARLLVKMRFDGVDINMGCPDRSVIKSGAGSALIRNKPLAGKIVDATKEGVGGKMPVSVKIRIGWNKPKTEDWVRFILDIGVDALTVHGRTTKQLSKAPADWKEIAKAARVRDEMGVKTVIIGNGDVLTLEEAQMKVNEYGVDGVMFGRAIFRNPWLFDSRVELEQVTKREKLLLMKKHAELFDKTWTGKKPFHIMRKFIKVYVEGFRGAKVLREELMKTETYDDLAKIVDRELNRDCEDL